MAVHLQPLVGRRDDDRARDAQLVDIRALLVDARVPALARAQWLETGVVDGRRARLVGGVGVVLDQSLRLLHVLVGRVVDARARCRHLVAGRGGDASARLRRRSWSMRRQLLRLLLPRYRYWFHAISGQTRTAITGEALALEQGTSGESVAEEVRVLRRFVDDFGVVQGAAVTRVGNHRFARYWHDVIGT